MISAVDTSVLRDVLASDPVHAQRSLIADFLVGAHAQAQADRLATRDRGVGRAAFRDSRVLDPAAG